MIFIKRMIERAVERQLNSKRYREEDANLVQGYRGKLTVNPIANGYLVCGTDINSTYCADHVAVAEFIVAQTTRTKLGVGTQMDLFDIAAEAGKAMNSAPIPYSGTIGTLDGHVHIKSKPDYL